MTLSQNKLIHSLLSILGVLGLAIMAMSPLSARASTVIYSQPTITASTGYTLFFYPIANGTMKRLEFDTPATDINGYTIPSGDVMCAVVSYGNADPGGNWTTPGGSFNWSAGTTYSTPGTYSVYWDGATAPNEILNYTGFGGSTYVQMQIYHDDTYQHCMGGGTPTAHRTILIPHTDGTSTSWPGNGSVPNAFALVDGDSRPPTDDTTRIDTTVPPDGDTVATSTAFVLGATGFVKPSDFTDQIFLNITYQKQACLTASLEPLGALGIATSSGTCVGGSYKIPITSDGAFDISTTTDLSASDVFGTYSMNISIVNEKQTGFWGSVYNFLFGYFTAASTPANGSIVATSTSFVLATSTPADNFSAGIAAELNAGIASTTNPDACVPFSGDFAIVDCTKYLFIPDVGGVLNSLNNLRQGLLLRIPWGYITLALNDLQYATSTEPIGIDYTFGSSSPPELQGRNYHINVFDHFNDELPDIVADDGSNKNIWDIVNPYFRFIVGMAIVLMILADLLGMVAGPPSTTYTESDSVSTPEIIPTRDGKGRKTGINHTSTITRRSKM